MLRFDPQTGLDWTPLERAHGRARRLIHHWPAPVGSCCHDPVLHSAAVAALQVVNAEIHRLRETVAC